MKRRLILILGLSLLLLGLYYHFAWPLHVISDLDARYRTVERDMAEQQVLGIMGHTRLLRRNPPMNRYAYWDDGGLGESETQRIQSAVAYSVATFFLPVTFEFTFDEHGRLVGKHRYD